MQNFVVVLYYPMAKQPLTNNLMTTEELFAKFEDHTHSHPKFDAIRKKLSNRPDLHAFLLLDTIVPAKHEGDMVCSACHDQIFLDVDLAELAAVITDDQIRELVACGILITLEGLSLCMFV